MTANSNILNRNRILTSLLPEEYKRLLPELKPVTLRLTHELIAPTLGARRAGIKGASIALKDRGIIAYSRQHIQFLDQQRLEAKACEC
jgi:hypothetical protein